jgi:L-ascorbate metabolism protein UlaG (beta-lactamase superfamily)
MDYHDALVAADFIQCKRIIGCHYDTFGLIKIDHAAAQNAFLEKDKKLILMKTGEKIEV